MVSYNNKFNVVNICQHEVEIEENAIMDAYSVKTESCMTTITTTTPIDIDFLIS